MRKDYETSILAQFAIRKIWFHREYEQRKIQPIKRRYTGKKTSAKKSIRTAYLIDSLKHPDEHALLKLVYGDMFYQFGILSSQKDREHRLKTKYQKSDTDFHRLLQAIEKDQGEADPNGQKMQDTIIKSDFFIRNSINESQGNKSKIKKYIDLLMGDTNYSPSAGEWAMSVAAATARKSLCLSRQVGAVILDSEGNIISTGCNDVPKFGGGQYPYLSSEGSGGNSDCRCVYTSEKKCSNDIEKLHLMKKIEAIILKDDQKRNEKIDEIKTLLSGIIEYSRAVHAEMAAIFNAIYSGKQNVRNGDVYCTTFPCHDCTKHMVMAGIKRVYYLEPYEKSLALKLHYDSVSTDGEPSKMAILPYEGIGPEMFMRFFEAKKRKSSTPAHKSEKKPRIMEQLDSFVEYERKIADHINDDLKIQMLSADEINNRN